MVLIRYPGSKSKLASQIMQRVPLNLRKPLFHAPRLYVEPFFGSGEIGFQIMREMASQSRVWVNDLDPAMAALWRAVHGEWKYLCRKVGEFTPTADAFYEFKKRDDDMDGSDSEIGFRKLALHRMSVSGFGVKSGGPIGGRSQTNSLYTVGCRWSPERIQKDVLRSHRIFKRFSDVRITNLDFRDVLNNVDPGAFVYLDPPYYEKGSQLYKCSMSREDHEDLAAILRHAEFEWVLSYDDHPEIRRLYEWAKFEPIFVTYSNAVCTTETRPKNQEVLIQPHAA